MFRSRWSKSKIKNVARQLRAVCKTATAEQYQVRSGCENRLRIPIDKFKPSVLDKVIEETESILLPGEGSASKH